jgi:aryl sulfotransferase
MRYVPLELFLNGIEGQRHRRYLKTHLPLDGMRYEPQLKYVYVSRDGRDVFMSMWNHYSNMTEASIAHMNGIPGRVGDPFPEAPEDIHDFWKTWVSDSWFDHESGGWPYWSHLSNVQSWWDYKDLPNIELFHYSDLLADPEGEIRRLADYLEIEVPAQHWPRILEAVSFDGMKSKAEDYVPDGGAFWKGGARTFMNKGTNDRWREVLTSDELAQYDALCEQALTPDCRHWLQRGRLG